MATKWVHYPLRSRVIGIQADQMPIEDEGEANIKVVCFIKNELGVATSALSRLN